MTALLEVRSLSAGYGRVPVLHGIDLCVDDAEIVGVLGHNGMGKTTLLKTIMGIVPATGGAIAYRGTDLTRERVSQRAILGVGYVPQGRGIFPNLTVRDNIRMGITATAGATRRTRSGESSANFRGSNACSTATAAHCPAASSNCSQSPAASFPNPT